MNNLQDLNDILFSQIQALDDPELTDEQFKRQVDKSEAVVKLSTTILNNARLALEAQKHFDDYGTGRTVDIPLLGISNQNLLIENKNLRRRLADKESYD
jgi:hypothetical protein